MTAFEYIAVLMSIIIGLGITYVLAGVGRLIRSPGRSRLYWVHLVWASYTLLYVVYFWWWQFSLRAVTEWSFQHYLVLILYTICLYLLCVVLFPREAPSDFREYYYERRKWFFGLWILVYWIDLVDTWFKGQEHFASLGVEYVVVTPIGTILFVIAILSRSERFHCLFAIATCAYQLSWIFRIHATIQ